MLCSTNVSGEAQFQIPVQYNTKSWRHPSDHWVSQLGAGPLFFGTTSLPESVSVTPPYCIDSS
ncbi:hypothetical protein BDN72DRAFT_186569 [Pluteus cervinus]|uniref:Uncharacterized protein n=1 Tax=Pluteus cervinus TaxID=181527 RepID=A0ACD3B6S2_9AGAR|nr:hypothetical protein BDN72DRAFT_186569 [Pluteus cervinus]